MLEKLQYVHIAQPLMFLIRKHHVLQKAPQALTGNFLPERKIICATGAQRASSLQLL